MLRKYENKPGNGKRHMKTLTVIAAAVFALNIVDIGESQAESLRDALVTTYVKNPTLEAQRARLRSTDEGVSIARSGFRPKVSGSASYTYLESRGTTTSKTETTAYSVTLTQPVFRGFRTINTLRQAEAEVLAGREDLRTTEQDIFLQTVTAYMDVVRDQAIVRLRQNNVKVLTKQLRATKDRFQVGEVTKTDVAQATARQSGSISQLSLAKANLASSRAVYQRLVGKIPGRLRAPNGLSKYIPKSMRVALEIGDAEHPEILAAGYREQSAKHVVKTILGELLPEVNFDATYAESHSSLSDSESSTLTARASMPIYQGGSISARVRQAKQTRVQREQQVNEASIRIKAGIIASWGQWEAAIAKLTSDRSQVEASKTALNGVREEEKVGQRTVLDVLDAEQEYLDAQVALSTTKRDYIVAGYSVLSSIGRLGASDLNLPVPLYDATRYYDKVKGKWFGFGKSRMSKR